MSDVLVCPFCKHPAGQFWAKETIINRMYYTGKPGRWDADGYECVNTKGTVHEELECCFCYAMTSADDLVEGDPNVVACEICGKAVPVDETVSCIGCGRRICKACQIEPNLQDGEEDDGGRMCGDCVM